MVVIGQGMGLIGTSTVAVKTASGCQCKCVRVCVSDS